MDGAGSGSKSAKPEAVIDEDYQLPTSLEQQGAQITIITCACLWYYIVLVVLHKCLALIIQQCSISVTVSLSCPAASAMSIITLQINGLLHSTETCSSRQQRL